MEPNPAKATPQRSDEPPAIDPLPIDPPASDPSGISRRRLLGVAGATGAAGLAAGTAGGAAGHALGAGGDAPALSTLGARSVPFHGRHQAGITTPPQARGHLAAFDLAAGAGRAEAAALMRRWTESAAAMAEGRAPAHDNQIAMDAGPSSLTVTFGFGASFFAKVGCAGQRPEALEPLPAFSADALDRRRSDGDLFVQIGADDALVAFHALRVLQRQAGEAATLRWQMNGFNRSPGATGRPMTARNLMGQIDGSNNPKPTDDGFDVEIFVPSGGEPSWMAGGSYAVVRRIRMLLDTWDHLSVEQQERVVGRSKQTGAPLSGGTEASKPDFGKQRADRTLAIAADAHIRVAAPEFNNGATMLRRPFSYHDGFDEHGAPDAGLLFIAWQADPRKGFTPVQRKLDRGDGLSRFLRHEASALFAVPGGCEPGEYVGRRLLEP